MDKTNFSDKLDEIYAIFGKKMPEDRVAMGIYERVKGLPDDFMAFAVRHFQDREDMPRNLGRYLLRDLWPDYLDRNPDLKSNADMACCSLCNQDTPGWRRVWTHDWEIKLVRCTCGKAANPNNEKIYMDSELEGMGYILTRPYAYDVEKIKRRENPNIGVNEPMRQAHKDVREEYDADFASEIVF